MLQQALFWQDYCHTHPHTGTHAHTSPAAHTHTDRRKENRCEEVGVTWVGARKKDRRRVLCCLMHKTSMDKSLSRGRHADWNECTYRSVGHAGWRAKWHISHITLCKCVREGEGKRKMRTDRPEEAVEESFASWHMLENCLLNAQLGECSTGDTCS